MSDTTLSDAAIGATDRSRATYIKFLSANDSGATGAHQSGILLSRKACPMIFGALPRDHVAKRNDVRVTWQDDVTTYSTFTWYESKGELRLTRLGRGFPYLNPEVTGALFVFSQMDDNEYLAYILNTDDEIEAYLTAFSLGPQDANLMFTPKSVDTVEAAEGLAIRTYVEYLGVAGGADWPRSEEVSREARDIQRDVNRRRRLELTNPDLQIIEYTRVEYAIFREIESQAYGHTIARGFDSIEDFVSLANTVLNRRKSRAGKSFEHHLASLFRANGLPFEEQVKTEGNKKPDFVFPSGDAYHDMSYPAEKLVILGAKTTCKDRWRQILNEADRIKDLTKYLVTLQQGISPQQLAEMQSEDVQLVVPKGYIKSYPKEFQDSIWSIKDFIDFARNAIS